MTALCPLGHVLDVVGVVNGVGSAPGIIFSLTLYSKYTTVI
jgi:hypothetical protein